MVPNPISTRDVMPIQARWQCDLRDDSLHWSDGVYDLFGLPRGIPVTRDAIVAMYLPECRDRLARLRATAIAECGSFTFEARIRRADGAIRWMRVTADVVTENGIARYLYGTKIDVTDEMASEADQAA
ncbi:PAS domain S-box-containing protein [Sphingomonas sp. BE123]|jgi:PAS domain S-box-containing protein|uniref:PAS domain-containing protein n=1 Tax=Sphingomonas sp. BE123 TaxID=2817842 RepID=UPI002862999E|nr:PAS domain-containing protein [Sphingomonas sp. BE123]MDR6850799.1 PAS domain S-box-containing protein [Sphingomonas sp. BE123]